MSDQFHFLDLTALAERLGWTVTSARAIHSRSTARRRNREPRPGDLPAPDARFGQSPVWAVETIEAWKAQRPGRGAGGGRPRNDERSSRRGT